METKQNITKTKSNNNTILATLIRQQNAGNTAPAKKIFAEITAQKKAPAEVIKMKAALLKELKAVDGKINTFVNLLKDNESLLSEYFGKNFKASKVFRWLCGLDNTEKVTTSTPLYSSFYMGWKRAYGKERQQVRNYADKADKVVKPTASQKEIQQATLEGVELNEYAQAVQNGEKVVFIKDKAYKDFLSNHNIKSAIKEKRAITLQCVTSLMVDEKGMLHLIAISEDI